MSVPSYRYWTLRRIDFVSYEADIQKGYQDRVLAPARQQFQAWFPSLSETQELSNQQDQKIQATLLSHFLNQDCDPCQSSVPAWAVAGLCLRCYVSHAIVHACQKLAQQFGDRYGFSTLDLLPLVLTDDGKTWIGFDCDRQSQIVLDNRGNLQPSSISHFSVEIIASFNLNKGGLWKWAYLLTRRHRELTRALWVEYGLSLSTPWARLNEIKRYQLESLSPADRSLVEVFHGVYRRDRRLSGARGKCREPSEPQLQEMRDRLAKRGIQSYSSAELPDRLKTIAEFLREQVLNPTPILQPSNSSATELEFLDEHRDRAIMEAIKRVLSQRLHQLQKNTWYADYAVHFLPGLRLIYFENKSQSQVARELNLNNQSQVSRFLKLKQMLNQIREQVMDRLIQVLLNKAGLNSPGGVVDANAFDSLIEHLTRYLDETVFLDAAREIRAGQSRKMTSLLAEQMRNYLNANPSD